MVTVGDEGFFARSGSGDWTYNGGEGKIHFCKDFNVVPNNK